MPGRARRSGRAAYLQEAAAAAAEADLTFLAGVARHTLLTSAARTAGDPSGVLSALGALLDHRHAFGAWAQLWIAMRALVETLSRLGRHRDAALLLGALAVSPRATPVHGSDWPGATPSSARPARLWGPPTSRCAPTALLSVTSGPLALARRLTRTGSS